MPNYTLINSYRRLTAHGGLIMYVHDDFALNEINENLPITHTSTLFESLFVEVWRKNIIYKKYVIGNIYQLPSYISDDVKSFINEFTALLNGLSMRSKSVYLCGDYNIALLKIHSVEDYSSFFDNIISSSFVPKITLPTRICDTRSSLIDNIYTNTIDKDHTSGILIRPISDHQMYFSIMNENVITSKATQKYIKIEVCSQENMNQFKNEIAKSEICSKLNQDLNTDPNYNYNILSKELQSAKNLHIPQKIKKFNKRKHKKEKWMNNDLLVQIVEKNKKYVKWKSTPITQFNYEQIKQNFKIYEKDTIKNIREVKKQYFDRIFTAYQSDMKKTWRTINKTQNRNKKVEICLLLYFMMMYNCQMQRKLLQHSIHTLQTLEKN